MNIINPVDLAPTLNTQHQGILDSVDQAKNLVTQENADIKSQVSQALAQILSKIIAENDQNQGILESLTSVNGNIDSSAIAINQHTDSKIADVLAEIVRTTSGSLYRKLYDAIRGRIDTRATPSDVAAARDLLRGASSRDLTQVYDLVAALGGWATPATVNAARDVINGHIGYTQNLVNGRATPANVNAARDNVNGTVIAARDSVNAGINNTYNLVNTRATPHNVNAARDAVINHVTAQKSPIKSIQRGSVGGSINTPYFIPIAGVNLAKSVLNVPTLNVSIGYARPWLVSNGIHIQSVNAGQAINIRSFSWEVIEYV